MKTQIKANLRKRTQGNLNLLTGRLPYRGPLTPPMVENLQVKNDLQKPKRKRSEVRNSRRRGSNPRP